MSTPAALTKTEYMMGRTCPTKVLHSRAGLPTTSDNDPAMHDRAHVGAIVHWLARRMYPEIHGTNLDIRTIPAGTEGTFAEVVIHGPLKHARVDILRCLPDMVKVVEVKSAKIPTADGTKDVLRSLTSAGTVHAGWQPYIYDLAFQVMALIEAASDNDLAIWNSDMGLRAELIMINPSFESSLNDLRQQFTVDPATMDVTFAGDEEALLQSDMLALLDVTDIVLHVISEVHKESYEIFTTVGKGAAPVLSSKCASCEFRVPSTGSVPNGFDSCWGELRHQQPFILDLAEIGRLKPIDMEDAVTVLARNGQARMTDLPHEVLTQAFNQRQTRQIHVARTRQELISPLLPEILAGHRYPHVFVDVEAISTGIPYWPNSAAYEITTVQWSAHRVGEPLTRSMQPTHSEWLHESLAHPAVEFLTTFQRAVDSAGTIYIWSAYERTAVKAAMVAAERMGVLDESLRDWALWFSNAENTVVVDMLQLARNYYMHPRMRGRASIKAVLPGIWEDYPTIRDRYAEYRMLRDHPLVSPYDTLPSLEGMAGLRDVREGTAAVQAYTTWLFNPALSTEERAQIRAALLAYCKLDTAAMAMIHEAWQLAGGDKRGGGV